MADKKLTRREFVQASAATAALAAAGTAGAAKVDPKKIPSYNEKMEYRRLGKTEMMVSAVCLGGHWKKIEKAVPGVLKSRSWLSAKIESDGFKKNRRAIIDRCMQHGINYVDACTSQEVQAYAEAIRGREDKFYMGASWYQEELRRAQFRTAPALLKTLEKAMKVSKREYFDLWRITMISGSSKHSDAEVALSLCPECVEGLYPDSQSADMQITPLSKREKEVLSWIKLGKSTWDISQILGISENTVKYHVSGILRKLNVSTRSQAVAISMELRLLDDRPVN